MRPFYGLQIQMHQWHQILYKTRVLNVYRCADVNGRASRVDDYMLGKKSLQELCFISLLCLIISASLIFK